MKTFNEWIKENNEYNLSFEEIESIARSNAETAFDQVDEYEDLESALNSYLRNALHTVQEKGGNDADMEVCEAKFRHFVNKLHSEN